MNPEKRIDRPHYATVYKVLGCAITVIILIFVFITHIRQVWGNVLRI